MAIVRCPQCGRVADGISCFACGYEWADDDEKTVANPPAPSVDAAPAAPPTPKPAPTPAASAPVSAASLAGEETVQDLEAPDIEELEAGIVAGTPAPSAGSPLPDAFSAPPPPAMASGTGETANPFASAAPASASGNPFAPPPSAEAGSSVPAAPSPAAADANPFATKPLSGSPFAAPPFGGAGGNPFAAGGAEPAAAPEPPAPEPPPAQEPLPSGSPFLAASAELPSLGDTPTLGDSTQPNMPAPTAALTQEAAGVMPPPAANPFAARPPSQEGMPIPSDEAEPAEPDKPAQPAPPADPEPTAEDLAAPANPFAAGPTSNPFAAGPTSGEGAASAAPDLAAPTDDDASATPSDAEMPPPPKTPPPIVDDSNPFASPDGPLATQPTGRPPSQDSGSAGVASDVEQTAPAEDFDPFSDQPATDSESSPPPLPLDAGVMPEVPDDAGGVPWGEDTDATPKNWDAPTEKLQLAPVAPPPTNEEQDPLASAPTGEHTLDDAVTPPARASSLLADSDGAAESADGPSLGDEPTVDMAMVPGLATGERPESHVSKRLFELSKRLDLEGRTDDAMLVRDAATLLAGLGH
jgi:hypothetical protein